MRKRRIASGCGRSDEEMAEYRTYHNEVSEPLIDAAAVSGNLEPTGTPVADKDVTADIRQTARELGFGEVGFTKYDKRYTYTRKKHWIKYRHAICLALEQDLDEGNSTIGDE